MAHDPRYTSFETERLVLEPLRLEHAPLMVAGLQEAALYEFIDEDPPESIIALRRRYSRWIAGAPPGRDELWLNWIALTRALGEACGYVQATLRGDQATIGYVILRQYWGKGFATEAVRAMLRELHRAFGSGSVRATVDPRNTRSVRLLTALGFEIAEVRPNAEWIKGVLTDEHVYQFMPRSSSWMQVSIPGS